MSDVDQILMAIWMLIFMVALVGISLDLTLYKLLVELRRIGKAPTPGEGSWRDK